MPDSHPDAGEIASMVQLGRQLAGSEHSGSDAVQLLEFLAGMTFTDPQLELLRLVARERPLWSKPEWVDLADPLALQVLEMVQTLRGPR